MFVVALFVLVGGGWLLDSAVQNRDPVASLLDVIRDPANARATVAQASGGAFVVDRGVSAGTTVDAVTSTGAGTGSANAAEHSTAAAQAVSWAQTQIGKPYKYGTTGPNTYDCSGLVQAAYRQAGVSLPRTTAGMILRGTAVARTDLQLGDLVFPDAGHVQLYAGNGTVVEAPSAGKKVRQVSMWGFLTARRVA